MTYVENKNPVILYIVSGLQAIFCCAVLLILLPVLWVMILVTDEKTKRIFLSGENQ